MALPGRLFFTLAELVQRWNKSENELLHWGAIGALTFSIYRPIDDKDEALWGIMGSDIARFLPDERKALCAYGNDSLSEYLDRGELCIAQYEVDRMESKHQELIAPTPVKRAEENVTMGGLSEKAARYWGKAAEWHFKDAAMLVSKVDPYRYDFEDKVIYLAIDNFVRKIEHFHGRSSWKEYRPPAEWLALCDDAEFDVPENLRRAVHGKINQQTAQEPPIDISDGNDASNPQPAQPIEQPGTEDEPPVDWLSLANTAREYVDKTRVKKPAGWKPPQGFISFIEAWIRKNAPAELNLSDTSIKYIATVVNPDKTKGPGKTNS